MGIVSSLTLNGISSPSTTNSIFTSTGFRQILNADVAAGAAIAYSKLSLGTSIVNADIATAAAIAISKLAPMTNKTLFTSNGATNSASASPTVSGSFTAEVGLNAGTTGAGTGEVKTSGAIMAGLAVYPSGQTIVGFLAGTGSVVAGASAGAGIATTLTGIGPNLYGILHIVDTGTGSHIFCDLSPGAVNNGGTAIKLIGADFSGAGSDTGTQIAIYLSGGQVTLRNRKGDSSTHNIRWLFIGG